MQDKTWYSILGLDAEPLFLQDHMLRMSDTKQWMQNFCKIKVSFFLSCKSWNRVFLSVSKDVLESGEPAEHLSALASYLDLVKVSLPEWVLDQTDASHQNNHHHHANSLHHNSQKKKMQSMAKQFGSLGKKFRKNLSKITQTVGGGGSGYGKLV